MRVRELRVLRLIHDFPGIVASQLRHKVELDKTLLSKNLALLESRGLIARTPDRRDNRLQCLSLTEEGVRVWQLCEQIGASCSGVRHVSSNSGEAAVGDDRMSCFIRELAFVHRVAVYGSLER